MKKTLTPHLALRRPLAGKIACLSVISENGVYAYWISKGLKCNISSSLTYLNLLTKEGLLKRNKEEGNRVVYKFDLGGAYMRKSVSDLLSVEDFIEKKGGRDIDSILKSPITSKFFSQVYEGSFFPDLDFKVTPTQDLTGFEKAFEERFVKEGHTNFIDEFLPNSVIDLLRELRTVFYWLEQKDKGNDYKTLFEKQYCSSRKEFSEYKDRLLSERIDSPLLDMRLFQTINDEI